MGFKPAGNIQSTSPSHVRDFVKEDKWKLASQLQKAIRHGKLSEAEQAARDLWKVEPAYLRYRLSVISVEDVAAGNPSTVLSAFEGGWKKGEVDARGGLDFLLEVVRTYAVGVKDRTPCDLMYCTKFVPDFIEQFGPWSDLSWDQASLLALDDSQPWWARALGAWRCAGTDKFQARTAFLPDLTGDWERWVELNREAYGDQVAQLMRIGENQREHHHVFIGLSLGQKDISVINPVLPDLPNIGYWLSAALDKHTSEGKKALTHMMTRNPEGRHMLRINGFEDHEHADLLGRMCFWMEGSRCDQEKSHALSVSIRRDNQERTLRGLDQAVLLDAFGDFNAWQQARLLAMGARAPRPHM